MHGDIAYFAYIVPPQRYHTWGIMNMFQPNFVSKVTLLNEDYCLYVLCIYMQSCKLRYLVKLDKFTLLITIYIIYTCFLFN